MLAASVAAIVLVGLVSFAMFQKPVYVAISQVYEEPASPKLLSDPSAAVFDANKYDTFLGEQIQLVQRLDVLTAAMSAFPAATYQEFGATTAQAAEAIQAQMKVARLASSYQISISLKGNDPQKTADIVNAITTSYLGAVEKANAAEYDQRAQLLGEERRRIATELQTARDEQTALGASIGVANPTGQSGNPYDAELSGIRSQLVEARASHDVAAAQLASLSGAGSSRTDGLTAAADELIAGDAGLGSMKATISQRKAQLNEQMSGMTPSNPIYKQDQDQISDLDRTLDRMTNELREKAARRLQDKLRTDLQRTGDIESRLNAQLARQIANATSAAPRLQRASEVAADIQRLDTRMAAVDDALRGLRLEVSGPAQVRLSLTARVPELPEANRKKQLLLLALPLALLFGIAAAILARKQNKRIYGGVDIDDVLGFPPLAILPARADVSQRVFEEYVLRLAAGIESANRTGGARTFLLTAVSLTTDIGPLATALKRKFEEIGVNIIVAMASDMLSPTEVVPSTGANAEPMTTGELARAVGLWSDGFVAANVARMKAEHGLVLIESEALLNCAQSEYVARCADATILIVECGVTTRRELFRAAELLHRLNVTGIGAVLEEIQLRYADADFRKAIDALDRRQSESPRQERQGRRQFESTAGTANHDIASPQPPAAPHAEPSPVAEEVAEEIAQDPALLETEGDRVELEYEPAHYHEVLHHARATRPIEHVLGWQLPVFGHHATQRNRDHSPSLLATANIVPAAAVAEAPQPEAVEIASQTGNSTHENTPPDPAIDAANGSLHEKMTPGLPARRDQPMSDGDPGMTRRSSWIGKLLRRDAAPVISIIPDSGDDGREVVVPEAVLSSSPLPLEPESTPTQPVAGDDYDASVMNRLNQISGNRPVATGLAPATDIATFKESHRLQILPEPVSAEATPSVAQAQAETAASTPAPVAEVVPTVRNGPKAWATADQDIDEPIGGATAPSTHPVAPPTPVPEPRRRLSFHQLIERTARQAATAVGSPQEQSEVAQEVSESEHPSSNPVEILGHVSEYMLVVPGGEAVAAEPEPAVESYLHVVEPMIEEAVPKAAEQTLEWLPEPMAAEVPEFHFSDRYIEASRTKKTDVPAVETYRPNPYELDDIEPVYEEASRNLNSGRWDPIPPLRPSMNSWRDRPSPVPANGNGARQNTSGPVKDGFNAYPPQRWIPEDIPPAVPEPEPLSEPMLSRQWGLLSKFQQSRLTSSSHPAAGGESASDAGREPGRNDDRPGSPNGDHRS